MSSLRLFSLSYIPSFYGCIFSFHPPSSFFLVLSVVPHLSLPPSKTDLETLDPRGRTPLHLAVTLGHLDSARVLLQYGADVSKENRNGWTGECLSVSGELSIVVVASIMPRIHKGAIMWTSAETKLNAGQRFEVLFALISIYFLWYYFG